MLRHSVIWGRIGLTRKLQVVSIMAATEALVMGLGNSSWLTFGLPTLLSKTNAKCRIYRIQVCPKSAKAA
jgi:hypothetical protein